MRKLAVLPSYKQMAPTRNILRLIKPSNSCQKYTNYIFQNAPLPGVLSKAQPHLQTMSFKTSIFFNNNAASETSNPAAESSSSGVQEQAKEGESLVDPLLEEEFKQLNYDQKVERMTQMVYEKTKERMQKRKDEALEYIQRLPVPLAEVKQIMSILQEEVTGNAFTQQLEQIGSSAANEREFLNEKFQKAWRLYESVYSNILRKKGHIKADTSDTDGTKRELKKFQFIVGQYCKVDSDLYQNLRNLLSYISEKVFAVKIEYQLMDARCLAIYSNAIHQAIGSKINELVFEYLELKEKETGESVEWDISSPEMEKEFTERMVIPRIYQVEWEGLEGESEVQVAVGKMENILKFHDGQILRVIDRAVEKKKNREAKEKEEKEKQSEGNIEENSSTTAPAEEEEEEEFVIEEEPPEDFVNNVEKRTFATVEGWINYKFQAMDALYRCDTMKV